MSYHLYKEYLEKYYEALGANKHYVVGYLSLHVGELVQHECYAVSEVAAANLVLQTTFATMDEIYNYCANCDAYISVLEVNNTLTE